MCWIKIDTKLLNWEWFTDPNTLQLWMYLLLTANYKDKKWRGIVIKRGQLVTSSLELAKILGMSRQNVRTILGRLQDSQAINQQTTNKFTIITICKYDEDQGLPTMELEDNQPTNQPTSQPSTNHNLRIIEYKNNNKYIHDTASSVVNDKNEVPIANPPSDEVRQAARRIYDRYPGKDPVTKRSTGKRLNDLEKIAKMLKSGKHTEQSLTATIDRYLAEHPDGYIQNLKTFLNGLPDYPDTEPIQETRENKQEDTWQL